MISIQNEFEGKFDFPIASMFQSAETIVAPIQETNQVQIVILPKSLTKADKARAVFNDCYKDLNCVPQRKDIINRLIVECGLTQNGAATYLQNMKSKAGLVVKK